MSGGAAAVGVPGDPLAQLLRAHQEEVAPGRVLGAVAELLERVGLQLPRRLVLGLGEDEVVDDLGDPAVVARLEGLARLLQHRLGAAHELDVAARLLDRRVLPEVGRVAVEPAHVALVDRLHVVADEP